MIFENQIIDVNTTDMNPENNSRFAVGMDIGGSHVCSAVVNVANGDLVSEPVTTPVDSKASAKPIVDAFAENIFRTTENFSGEISGIGFAVPGPFDYENGISTISGVAKYESIFGLDFRKTLYARLLGRGISDFRFTNDASAFALGECLSGAGKGADRVVGITLGTGLGSGFVDRHHLVCCGDNVPLNGWVYHLPYEDGIADDAFSTRWVCRRFHELTGQTVKGAKEVADAYGKCAEARQLFDEYGTRLAAFLAPLLKRFDADVLVLGGNISRAYPLFGKVLVHDLEKSGCRTAVTTSQLMDKAPLAGAASLFM